MKKLSIFLALLVLSFYSFAQVRTITGVVTSAEDKEPLIQVVVQVKGTQTAVVTDMDGKYTVKVQSPEAVLVFSYTGYATQEIMVGDRQTIDVVMSMATEEIDEVMVVAFGKAKKSAFTGSAVSVGSKELERKQVSNVMNALSGKVPGVTVSSSNNQPGSESSVQIRGVGSFSASSEPLYVVDGVPYDGDVSAINPADVESTVLLKDASSAALYGARAANGVVMITTKNGANAKQTGVANINVSAKVGYNSRGVSSYERITDPKKYVEKYYEALYYYYRYSSPRHIGSTEEQQMTAAQDQILNRETGLIYFPFTLADPNADWFTKNSDGTFSMNKDATLGRWHVDPRTGEKYWMQPDDWDKEAYVPNMRQEYNLSVSGRSDKVNYFFSAGYLNDKGYLRGSSFERYSTRLRGDYTPKSWLKLGGNVSLAYSDTDAYSGTQSSSSSDNIFAMINYAGPHYPIWVRDANKQIAKNRLGLPIYDFGSGQFPGLGNRPMLHWSNPLATKLYDLNTSETYTVGMRDYIDFILPYGFKVTLNAGFDFNQNAATSTENPLYGQNASTGGAISKSESRSTSLNLQQLLSWNYSFDEHHLDVVLGHEYYASQYKRLAGSRKQLFMLKTEELSGAIADQRASSSTTRYRVEGYLARASYDWKERYFLSLSFRRDGSSRFAKHARWGNFGSMGLSWLIHQESFMEPTRGWLDMLKLKGSYGIQGNDNIPLQFGYKDLYTLRNLNGEFGVSYSAKGSKDLTWETSHNLNVGLEFAVLGHRLTGSVEFFRRAVSDMLFEVTVPPSSGYSSYWDNVGKMSNTGVDFELRGVLYRTKKLEWTAYLNGSHVTNRIQKLPEEWNKSSEWGYIKGSRVFREGGSLDDLFLPKFLGLNDKGESRWKTKDGETTDYAVATKNENREIFPARPDILQGGFGTNVDFYDFDFGVSFTYAFGGRDIDFTYMQLMHGGASNGYAMHKDLLKAWTPERTNTNIPRMTTSASAQQNGISDRFFVSTSYLSIDNVTLGYTLPKQWAEKLFISTMRVYAVADNIWLFSARKGFDPRFGSGIGYKAMRTVSLGLTANF
ncbi:MAG: SusC/RagA family TonB-linked outer membrane protein [Bacteroides sp.]